MTYTLLTPWGNNLNWEHATFEECEKAAQEWFSRQYDDEPMKNGETREEAAYIVEMDDKGDEVIRVRVTLFYEKERSDFEEHNTIGL